MAIWARTKLLSKTGKKLLSCATEPASTRSFISCRTTTGTPDNWKRGSPRWSCISRLIRAIRFRITTFPLYNQLGQFENALDNARQSVQLDPDSASGYANLAQAYMGLNRLDEAKTILNQALERKLNPLGNHLQLAAIAWVQNDAEMEKHLEAAQQLPGGDMTVSGTRSAIAACRGQIKAARRFRAEVARSRRATAITS